MHLVRRLAFGRELPADDLLGYEALFPVLDPVVNDDVNRNTTRSDEDNTRKFDVNRLIASTRERLSAIDPGTASSSTATLSPPQGQKLPAGTSKIFYVACYTCLTSFQSAKVVRTLMAACSYRGLQSVVPRRPLP